MQLAGLLDITPAPLVILKIKAKPTYFSFFVSLFLHDPSPIIHVGEKTEWCPSMNQTKILKNVYKYARCNTLSQSQAI